MTEATEPVPRGRFAPSPTGRLHLGHARTMLLCWLQMRALGGRVVLRIEDPDRARVRPGSEAGILRDLRRLGFDWDEGPDVGGPHGPYRQSERTPRYEAVLARLEGRTFPCSCTRKEIRAAAGTDDGELRYPGTCRAGTPPDRPAGLRLRVEPGLHAWDDLWRGPRSQDPAAVCGDFLLRGKDGAFTYQLACTVDDVDMGITHVLRGDDIEPSTGRQLLLWSLLGAPPPLFAHVPLVRDEAGQRLAKSRGSPPLEDLHEAGVAPEALIGELAAGLGLLPEARPVRPEELIEPFRARFPGLLRVRAGGEAGA